MTEKSDRPEIPSAARIDALIDEMERCAWTYRNSEDAVVRASGYVRWEDALSEIVEFRRDRAHKIAVAAASAVNEPAP